MESSELRVFGYASRLFASSELDGRTEEQLLIPWQGEEDLLIDRYDCRLYLIDLSVKTIGQSGEISTNDDSFTDAIEEELCETERYVDLKKVVGEEQKSAEKRGKGAEVAFNYEDRKREAEDDDGISDESDDEGGQPYEPPKTLKIPMGTNLPSTLRLGHLIERTARFVAMNGNQMEIVIKAKHRKHNERFDFLEFDNPLNPFYKFLCKAIREKKWIPPAIKPSLLPGEHTAQPRPSPKPEEDSESDDSDGGYLHPLLMADSATRKSLSSLSVPLPPPPTSKSNPYVSLYEGLHADIRDVPSTSKPQPPTAPLVLPAEPKPLVESDPVEAENYERWHKSFYGVREGWAMGYELRLQRPSPFAPNPPPPLSSPSAEILLSQINVAARYVASNGEFAERRLLDHNNGRLDFLYPDNKFLVFYHSRVRFFQVRMNPGVMSYVRSKYHAEDPDHPPEVPPPTSRPLAVRPLDQESLTIPLPPVPPLQTRAFPEGEPRKDSNDEEIKRIRKDRARQFMIDLLRRKGNAAEPGSSPEKTISEQEIVVPADIAVPSLISNLVSGQLQRLTGSTSGRNVQNLRERSRSRDRRSRSKSRERKRRKRSRSREHRRRRRSRSLS